MKRVRFTPFVLSADTAVLSHARLRSNSTGARHSTPRPLDAGRGRRLGGSRDPGPEKPRASPASGGGGGRVPKSASVSALSLIVTAGNMSNPSGRAAVGRWFRNWARALPPGWRRVTPVGKG